MKKINTLIIIFIFTIFSSYGQENKFERELNRFRFNLNEQLGKYEDEKIYNLNFNNKDSIILLIDDFTSKNKRKIRAYRENILKKYENNADFKFDTSKYEKVDFSDINDNLNNFDLGKNVPLSKLLWINPISEISSFKTIYFSQKKGTVKLAGFNVKTRITSSLIKTQRMSNYKWEIIDNSYDIVSKFVYDLNEGRVTKVEIFERKTNR